MEYLQIPKWLKKKAENHIAGSSGFAVVAPHWYKEYPTFYVKHEESVCVGPPIVFFWDGEKFCNIPFPESFDYLTDDEGLNIDI